MKLLPWCNVWIHQNFSGTITSITLHRSNWGWRRWGGMMSNKWCRVIRWWWWAGRCSHRDTAWWWNNWRGAWWRCWCYKCEFNNLSSTDWLLKLDSVTGHLTRLGLECEVQVYFDHVWAHFGYKLQVPGQFSQLLWCGGLQSVVIQRLAGQVQVGDGGVAGGHGHGHITQDHSPSYLLVEWWCSDCLYTALN